MSSSIASDDTREAIADMLRAPADEERTNVGDPNDLVTDVNGLGDPHEAVTVVANPDAGAADSIVTIAEPLSIPELASAAPAAVGTDSDSIASSFGAQATFSSGPSLPTPVPAAWRGDADSRPAKSPIARVLASPKRIALAVGAAVLLVVVLVFALGGSEDKRPASSAGPADKPTETAAAEPVAPVEPVAPPIEEAPAAAEPNAPGSAGSAETGPAPGETGSGETAAPAPEAAPAPHPVAEKPVVKRPVVKRPAQKKPAKAAPKRVATKPVAKPAAKPVVKKPAAKTATKTAKPAVQKPAAKKWDPNTLFPQKKK